MSKTTLVLMRCDARRDVRSLLRAMSEQARGGARTKKERGSRPTHASSYQKHFSHSCRNPITFPRITTPPSCSNLHQRIVTTEPQYRCESLSILLYTLMNHDKRESPYPPPPPPPLPPSTTSSHPPIHSPAHSSSAWVCIRVCVCVCVSYCACVCT